MSYEDRKDFVSNNCSIRDIYTLTQSYYSLKSVTLRKLPCEKKYVFFIFITQ